jgi:hypothetical protein
MLMFETDPGKLAGSDRPMPEALAREAQDAGDLGVAAGRRWLADLLVLLDELLLRRPPGAADLVELERLCAGPSRLHLIPRSAPELAEPIDARRIAESRLLARLASLRLVAGAGESDIYAGDAGHLRLRQQVRYELADDPARGLRCAEPVLVVAVVADLALGPGPPRVVACLVCYDDARVVSTQRQRPA